MAEDRNKLQEEYNKLLQEGKERVRNLTDAQKETLKIVEKIFQISGGQLDIFEEQVDVIDKLTKSQKENKEKVEEASKKTTSSFQKLKESTDKVKQGFKEGNVGIKQFGGNLLNAVKTGSKLGLAGLAAGAAFGAVLFVGKKLLDTVIAIDKASAQLVKTTGILDASLSTTLIEATENTLLLGGNIERAGEFAASLVSNLSPAISLTGALVGNVAQVGERFGLSVDNAGKLTQIVSELTNTTFEQASSQVEGIVDGLGRLGPAVARNLAESYDSVIDRFGIGLDSLVEQTRQATRLGLSLSKVADISRGLLDFQSSISAEFRASALLGQQINLQKARQLAFEGDIFGATNAVLDQVEQLGGLENLNTLKREALAEAAGISVSELQKELNLRRQIGTQDRITQATRDSALGKIEELQRRLQGQLFKILASPEVQNAFDNIVGKLNDFITDGGFQKIADKLSNAFDFIGRLFDGGIDLQASFLGKQVAKVIGVDDAVITPQGEVVKTNPRDFIIATQNPQQLTSGGNDVMMAEMVSLLRDLKQNGVRSEVNLDGKKVSKQLATSNRY